VRSEVFNSSRNVPLCACPTDQKINYLVFSVLTKITGAECCILPIFRARETEGERNRCVGIAHQVLPHTVDVLGNHRIVKRRGPGGYFPGPHGFDSIILGYYRGDDLIYVARTRAGFVPATRRQVFFKLKNLVIETCPFVNLPDTRKSRFGEELNAEKMKKAVWVKPEIVAQIEFLEWTEADRLRHSKFVGLREDKRRRMQLKSDDLLASAHGEPFPLVLTDRLSISPQPSLGSTRSSPN
jgi:hypothetical protein